MKYNLIRIISIMFLSTSLFADNFSDVKIEMRVNGHSYFLDNDINTGIIEYWQSKKDSIEIDVEEDDDVQSINLPDLPSYIKYLPNSTDNKMVKMEIFFADVELNVKLKSLKPKEYIGAWLNCPFSGGNFKMDIMINVDYKIGVDTSGVYLERIGEANSIIEELGCNAGIELGAFEERLIRAFEDKMGDSVPLKVTIIPINKFASSGGNEVVVGVDPVQEIQDLMDSFPIDVSIGTLVYENEKIFIINLSLMPGYGNNLSLYENGSPQLPQDPVLNLSGIGMNGDKYQFYPGSAGSWQDEITGLHDIIQNDLGLTHVRVDAIWKYVCPILPSIDINQIDNYPNITQQTIDEFNLYIDDLVQNPPQLPGGISSEKIGWQWLDIVINDLYNDNMTPIVIVGQGFSGSVPSAENAAGVNKIIAPGEPRGTNASNYIEISDEMYLYWLEVYTRAVVQKYADKVQYWEAETELNAARYTESFDWWRKGSAWNDDTGGGFLDQVASTLYSVIHDEDPNAQVVHAFHMFEMARCLDQWSAYYDIAGINFYPNELNAYPVFGFLVGEMVYSARRAIDALGLNKPVWVIETSYSDYCDEDKWNCNDPGSEPVFSGDNLYHWTEERQSQYLQEALETSAVYGAEVFNWFNVVASNSGTVGEGTYSTINNYGGLYNSDNSQRIAFNSYKDLFNESSDLAWVTGESWYNNQEELTSGTFKINNINTGISSGESIRLYKVPQEIIVINQKLLRETVNDSVFHHDWNGEANAYKIKNSFNPINVNERIQEAIYDDRETVSISSNPVFPDFHKFVKLADPWRLDAQNQQPNELIALEDTNVYSVFLDQQPGEGAVYEIKAPNLFATVDGIYEFTGWGGANVSYTTPGNRETEVVFEAANATATASYALVSNQGNEAVIPAGDEMVIPAGANIVCADFFTLKVEGKLNIAGTKDEPVSLVTNFATWDILTTAFIEVLDGGKLYGSRLQISGEPGNYYSPPLIKAQPGSIVKIDHSTFKTDETALMVIDAYVELSRCVISPVGTPTNSTSGIDITINDNIHNSYAQNNYIYNQVLLENCTIRGMDTGIEIYININASGYWAGLYTHNGILTENNTGLFAEGYLSSNIELDYVNMSNSTNYDISQSIITNHIQTSDPQLDVNHYPTASSPVIDWGDPNSPYDPDGTIADLGAYYIDAPPSAPTGFSISGSEGQNPTCSWSPNTELDLDGYKLYKDEGAGWALLRTLDENTTSYTDNSVTIGPGGKFSSDVCYKVSAFDLTGQESSYSIPRCKPLGGVSKQMVIIPDEYALHAAFPNPFNPTTSIRFDLPERSRVTMVIYDVLGRKITTLIHNSLEPGFHEILWNGKDDNGNPVSTGMYVYRFSAFSEESEKQFNKSNKLVLMK